MKRKSNIEGKCAGKRGYFVAFFLRGEKAYEGNTIFCYELVFFL